ncbi:hypothetical protein DNH61_10705 [Paenibacillus sambharensis]|uniref:Uncharacterized protein n=1 Tax=Paenibacillus sambharensis TaxID=1803190 RepID=A0A2W1LN71_9BACL|nr:hypothetical protein [Paenibacillus sambharensis]PZD95904.1 hypothetical protein DNH61_10705 [Paenibacillus sambharensis]
MASDGLTEQKKAEIIDNYGFNDAEPLRDTQHQVDYDYGTSFDFSTLLIPSVILLLFTSFILLFLFKRRKR